MKSCLLTIIVYLLVIQCIKLFNYVCFNAFGPFLRELCCVAYRLAASVIVSNTPIKPSNYGDKCCKLYVLMFGLWLFSRFTPPLIVAAGGLAG